MMAFRQLESGAGKMATHAWENFGAPLSVFSHSPEGTYVGEKAVRYASWPDQWKSRQASKQNAYKEFVDAFGSETKSQKKSIPTVQCSHAPAAKNNVKQMRKEIEQCLQNSNPFHSSLLNISGPEISLSKLGFPASKHQRKEAFSSGTASPSKQESKKLAKNDMAKATETNKDKEIPLGMGAETSLSKVTTKRGSRSKRHLQDDNSKTSRKKHKSSEL